MKALLFAIVLVAGPLAQAQTKTLTKAQVIRVAARAVVNSGQGARVETCSGASTFDRLVDCVARNTNSDTSFWKLPSHAPIKKPVNLSYLDSSGDCALHAAVFPSGETRVGRWDCD